MDRISDSGSDDYGSTPYGDTFKSLYIAINQHYMTISLFTFGHITGEISDYTNQVMVRVKKLFF